MCRDNNTIILLKHRPRLYFPAFLWLGGPVTYLQPTGHRQKWWSSLPHVAQRPPMGEYHVLSPSGWLEGNRLPFLYPTPLQGSLRKSLLTVAEEEAGSWILGREPPIQKPHNGYKKIRNKLHCITSPVFRVYLLLTQWAPYYEDWGHLSGVHCYCQIQCRAIVIWQIPHLFGNPSGFDISCYCAAWQAGISNKHFTKMVVIALAFLKDKLISYFFLLQYLCLGSIRNSFWCYVPHHPENHGIKGFRVSRTWGLIIL